MFLESDMHVVADCKSILTSLSLYNNYSTSKNRTAKKKRGKKKPRDVFHEESNPKSPTIAHVHHTQVDNEQ